MPTAVLVPRSVSSLPQGSGLGLWSNTAFADFRQGQREQLVSEEWKQLGDRLVVFGCALLGALIDLAFIGGWILLQQLSEKVFTWLGSLPAMEGVFTEILKYTFEGATLVLVLGWVVCDVIGSVRRFWRAAK